MYQIITTIVENGNPVTGSVQNISGDTSGELAGNTEIDEKGVKYRVIFHTTYSKKVVEKE